MNIKKAKLCLDCEEIFDTKICPKCTGRSYGNLVDWIKSLENQYDNNERNCKKMQQQNKKSNPEV